MSLQIVLFAVLLVAAALLSKLVGCGIGARFSGFRGMQCVQVGCGMACRGRGGPSSWPPRAWPWTDARRFGPVIIMVVCCGIHSILLKLSFQARTPQRAGGQRPGGLLRGRGADGHRGRERTGGPEWERQYGDWGSTRRVRA